MCRTDRECIEHCLDGHPEAFRHLVGRYQAVLLSCLGGQLGNREWAEEAAQEVFVRAWFGLGKLQKREAFFSWLMGIAGRVVKEHWRSEQRQRVLAAARASDTTQPQAANDLPLERVIAELPDVYREVILLRYYTGRSCVQIAEELAIPLGTVTKRLSRAYTMLRDGLLESDRPREHSEERP
jgi:RNA polymerase sigma-70 factor, ECF subfamily